MSAHGGRDTSYGFPAIDGQNGGLKVATEQYEGGCDPDHLVSRSRLENHNACSTNA